MAGEEIFVSSISAGMSPEAMAALLAVGAVALFFLLLVLLAVYIYISFAFMAIARRTKAMSPGIAWIPVVGPALIASRVAKMHWWPILLLVGIVIPVVGGLFQLVFAVFFIIWLWYMFEKLRKPAWWAILCIIPIVNLVLIGIAAWGKK